MAHALARWARSAEEREEKLRKMRGTLYVLGDGHKTKKCLNSWKELVGRNHRAMLSVARMLGGQKRKAWELEGYLLLDQDTRGPFKRARRDCPYPQRDHVSYCK